MRKMKCVMKMAAMVIVVVATLLQPAIPAMAKVSIPRELLINEVDISEVHPEVELIGVYQSKDAEITSADMSAASWKQNYLETSEKQIEKDGFYDCLVKVVLPKNLDLTSTKDWDLEVELTADIAGHKICAEAEIDDGHSRYSGKGKDSADLYFADNVEVIMATVPLSEKRVEVYPGDKSVDKTGRKISSTYCFIEGIYDDTTGCFGIDSDGNPIAVAPMSGDTMNRLSVGQNEIFLMARFYVPNVIHYY